MYIEVLKSKHFIDHNDPMTYSALWYHSSDVTGGVGANKTITCISFALYEVGNSLMFKNKKTLGINVQATRAQQS